MPFSAATIARTAWVRSDSKTIRGLNPAAAHNSSIRCRNAGAVAREVSTHLAFLNSGNDNIVLTDNWCLSADRPYTVPSSTPGTEDRLNASLEHLRSDRHRACHSESAIVDLLPVDRATPPGRSVARHEMSVRLECDLVPAAS